MALTDADEGARDAKEVPGPEAGLTFSSSADGARLCCMRMQVYGAFALVFLIKALTGGGSNTTTEFWAYESIVIAYLLATALVYHWCPPRSLRMRMTIQGAYVTFVKHGVTFTAPVASLRRIDIKRSWLGRHRIVRVWDGNGVLVTLVSPRRGALLEWWAANSAAREGVPFWIGSSHYLTLEPVSTLVVTLLVGGLAGALGITNLVGTW